MKMFLTTSSKRLVARNSYILKSSYQYINLSSAGCSQSRNEAVAFNQDQVERPVMEHKFIPMTRRTLIRKVLEQNYLVQPEEKEQFVKFQERLEIALSNSFHGVLSKLKHLYDPLNPDKETMILQHFGPKDRLSNEFHLLQKLSTQLYNANFQELSREHILSALSEHPVYEGVLVNVNLKDYDVLRFWVLSEDEQPLPSKNSIERIQNFFYVHLIKWPKYIKTYKRVVIAVRTKNQNKLMLKAFKDIPQNGLEYFLPKGKIAMSKYDKSLILTTVTIGAISIVIKVLSFLNGYEVSWIYAIGGVTGLLAFKSWNAYKNKRNNYLANLSKMLYYKSIANNRALLTLIVDRAEDEIYKATLLAYVFIKAENILKGKTELDDESYRFYPKYSITVDELKASVDSWLEHKYNVKIDFDPQAALKQLEKLGLLKVKVVGSDVHLKVASVTDALQILPTPTELDVLTRTSEREEDLEVEEIFPENDLEFMDTQEKNKQTKAESNSFGWK